MEAEDFMVDHYLDQVSENKVVELQEDDALVAIGGVTLAIGSVLLVKNLIMFFLSVAAFKSTVKIDPKLSKEFNSVINDGKQWRVRVFPEETPNAFAITGKDVFITTGLLKMLNKREVMGVLLHEAWHCKDLHVWKNVASESVFIYLIVFCAMTASAAVPFLGVLVAFLMKNVYNIMYARLVGRRHELKADEYAVKFGYGKELISSLSKMEKWADKIRSQQHCNKICQLERSISEAIDEHPPTKKRIEIILRKSKELDRAVSSGFRAIQKFVVGVFKNNG